MYAYARIKEGNCGERDLDIKKGILYPIKGYRDQIDHHYKGTFSLILPGRGDIYCLQKNCAYLNGGEWELFTAEDVADPNFDSTEYFEDD